MADYPKYHKLKCAYEQLSTQITDYRFTNLQRLKILHNFINVFHTLGELDMRNKLAEGKCTRAYELAVIEDTYFESFLRDYMGLVLYKPTKKKGKRNG